MTDSADPTQLTWRKSSFSGGGNQCVEVALLPAGHVAMRDSKNRDFGMHVFSRAAWRSFISGIKDEQAR